MRPLPCRLYRGAHLLYIAYEKIAVLFLLCALHVIRARIYVFTAVALRDVGVFNVDEFKVMCCEVLFLPGANKLSSCIVF